MSSDLFRVKVLSIEALVVALEVSIVDGEGPRVPTDEVFIAQMLASAMGDERIGELFPDAGPEDPCSFADEWMGEHAAEVVEPGSAVLFDERDHPRVPRDYHPLKASLLKRYGEGWERDPREAVAAVTRDLAQDGLRLDYADEPELYLTGTLDDVVEEAVTLLLEATPTPRASLRFRVRDAKWVAHLAVGDEFGTTVFER